MRPLEKILSTELLDGSVVCTVYLGVSASGPGSPLENFEVFSFDGYWFETAIIVTDKICVLRRHKTKAQAIVWHEEYLDKVVVK